MPLQTALFLTAGCSSGSSSSNSPTTVTGKFIDGPVQGIRYESNSHQGVTNSLGEFNYTSGETTTFSYNNIAIGQAEGAKVVTPRSLTSTSDSLDKVLNILRFLQTLDTDNDHSNGVQLPDPETFTTTVTNINFNQSAGDFESNADVLQFIDDAADSSTLIASSEAMENFEEALSEAGVHPLENRTVYRFENGSGSGFGLQTALWCDTWYFSNGKIYQNKRTIENLKTCSDVDKSAAFATYKIDNNGDMVWQADFENDGNQITIPMVILNESAPFIYRFGSLTGDRERNRLYETKAEVESLLSSSVFEANDDLFELELTESSGLFTLTALFKNRDCTVVESRYELPSVTDSEGSRYDSASTFRQEGSNCIVPTTFTTPNANTKFFVVARGLSGIGLENLKASITYQDK